MFVWLNSQAVRSDRGFEVESMGRFSVHYREGGRWVDVYVERGLECGKPCVIIEPSAFERWNGESAYVAIPHDKQQQMLENFIAAMEFQGVAVVVT